MPITLTTPKTIAEPGQAVETYAQLKIAGFDFPPPGNRIVLKLQYGNTVDGVWVSKAAIFRRTISDTPEVSGPEYNAETKEVVEVVTQEADLEFSDMVGGSVLVGAEVDGLLIFNVVGDALYQHMLDRTQDDPDYQGTIE